MEENIKIGKYRDIMASFNNYVEEENRKNLKKFEKDFWKDTPEMYQKYLELADDIEVQKMDHEIDLYDLDESKFNQGKEGLGTIQNRQKELRKENEQYIKDLFLFKAKKAEKKVITAPANVKEDHEGLKLVLDKELYKKYLTYEKKVSRKKAQLKKNEDSPFYKKKSFVNFLKDRYPEEAKIFDEKDTAIMLKLDGIVENKKYDLSALAQVPFKKRRLNDPSMNIPKNIVTNIAADINKNRTINKRLKR